MDPLLKLCRLLSLGALALGLLLYAPRAAAGVHLAEEGETLGDAEVVSRTEHPEFHRYGVRLPDGRVLTLEVTLTRPNSSPSCAHHGLSVYPRWELLVAAVPGTELELDPAGDAATEALCARLETSGAELDIGEHRPSQPMSSEGLPGMPVAEAILEPTAWHTSTREHPLQGTLLVLLGALVAACAGPVRRGWADLPRAERLDGLLVALVAVGARLLWSPRGLQVAPDAGYERLYLAWGLDAPHPLYGDGYASLHAALQRATGFDPQAVFGLHLALSCLAPVVLYALARGMLRAREGALVAGLGLALLPVALRLAGAEVAHVPLATLELLAVAGAWGFWQVGAPALALLGALAAGFSAHLRPEAVPVLLLPLALLGAGAWRHRTDTAQAGAGGLAVVLLLALVGWRLADFPELRDEGPVRFSTLLELSTWRGLLTPFADPRASDDRIAAWQIFLSPSVTSPILPLLVLLGLGGAALRRRDGGTVAVALAWWALALLPVFPKSWPLMDAWRLQLPAQAPLLLLAGLGTMALTTVAWRWGALVLVIGSSLLYLPRVTEVWAGQAEWALMQRAIPQLPATATVLVPDHEKHGRKVAQVGALLTERAGMPEVRWALLSPFAAAPAATSDLFVWVNLSCRITELPGMHTVNDARVNPCIQVEQHCTLTPFLTETLPDRHDLDIAFAETPAVVGLYRVDACRPPTGSP